MRILAFSIHVLTVCGAALALLALLAATRGDWTQMFFWLGLALLVDAVDGPLARALAVAERLPRWAGDTLDLIVDFVTYVFVPAYAIAASGLLPAAAALAAGLAIVISGGLYFADRRMKTEDNFFRGFPALWNMVAFYLVLLRPPAWATAAAIALFVALTFAPLRFAHPLRVARWRPLTLALLALWAILAMVALLARLAPPWWVNTALCALGLYFFVIGWLPRGY